MRESLCLVQHRLALIERRGSSAITRAPSLLMTGHQAIDRALGGGVMRGRMHEVLAGQDDAGSGSGFAALLVRLVAQRRCGWLRRKRGEGPVGFALRAWGQSASIRRS